MKRILIITQYFYPENFKSNDLAFELVKRGYEVDALVGIPNYPEGKYFSGYGIFHKRKEIVNGVRIYRVFQTPRGKKAGALGLTLNYLTFVFSSYLWVLWFALFRHYDAVFVHEPSPITQGLPAVLLKRLMRIPFYIWIMDIWPDAMSSGGGIKNKYILNGMTKMVQHIYNHATKILITSKDFASLICKQGDYKEKLVYYPNWSSDFKKMPILDVPKFPDGLKIMMAGNLGSAQCIRDVLQAALLMKDVKEVKWIFVGDGSEKAYLDDFVRENNLEDTVFAVGRYPFGCMPAFYEQADAMLITLRAKFPHLKAVVPARLQSYMSSGKPILGMIDGGTARLIKEAKCGYVAPAEDVTELVRIIKEEILPHREAFAKMGVNGRKYFLNNFTLDNCIEHFIKILNNE